MLIAPASMASIAFPLWESTSQAAAFTAIPLSQVLITTGLIPDLFLVENENAAPANTPSCKKSLRLMSWIYFWKLSLANISGEIESAYTP